MRKAGDVGKVWLYPVAVVVLGAWLAPLVYNGGKALAEVSGSRTTNGPLEWLGAVCRLEKFPWFFQAALLLAVALLFFPWLEWLHGRQPLEAAAGATGQRLRGNRWGVWQIAGGFLLVSGLWLTLAMALVQTGVLVLRPPAVAMSGVVRQVALMALGWAVGMEVWFRGIALGVFLRALRPAVAVVMNALLFALLLAAIPPPGIQVPRPDAADAGFTMLRLLANHWLAWPAASAVVSWFLLGSVLAYARWRTASLWLPIGLHAGWWFSQAMQRLLVVAGRDWSLVPGELVQSGLIPSAAILLAGMWVHFLTKSHERADPS